jgi:CDP-4-dehydro-6-deoxyglucose reductase
LNRKRNNMPDAKFMKPWHGIPREEIEWHPHVDEDVCIGCGTCVTGCSRLVYRFDYDRLKAVVVDPLNCMVGCTTCANTCPTNAIGFPPLRDVLDLEQQVGVHHAVEDDLLARREQLQFKDVLPHPDRAVELQVTDIVDATPTTRLVTLVPRRPEDCLCQFIPGQYLEVQVPGSSWLARAYSVGNAPRSDDSVELQVRRVEEGRLSGWVFADAKVGDVVIGRGPAGSFTMRSPVTRPLVFVAGGTGFAPIKALIEQQLGGQPDRRMLLVWGVTDATDFYELDVIGSWLERDPNLDCLLAAASWPTGIAVPVRATAVTGFVSDAIDSCSIDLTEYDAYVAGPGAAIVAAAAALGRRGVAPERVSVDSFGLQATDLT